MPLVPSAKARLEKRHRFQRNLIAGTIVIETSLLYVFYLIVAKIIDGIS